MSSDKVKGVGIGAGRGAVFGILRVEKKLRTKVASVSRVWGTAAVSDQTALFAKDRIPPDTLVANPADHSCEL